MRSSGFLCLLCLLLILTPRIVNAQPRAPKSSVYDLVERQVWEVPANSTSNRLLLTVENTGGQQTESITVSMQDLSVYLHFEPEELVSKPLAPGTSQEVTLTFSVDPSAAIGKVDNIVVASKDWIDRFANFMWRFKWEFFDEGQTDPETAQRSIKFPHFDWKGN